MPGPLLIPLGLLAAGALGFGFGVSGARDLAQARKLADRARSRHDGARHLLENDRRHFERAASEYGARQIATARDVVGRFVKLLERLDQRGAVGAGDMLDGLFITPAELRAYRGLSAHATQLLRGAGQAVGAGAAASTATVGLVGLLAVSSTGTPIVALSGAAAQSATLAWLGGGSLAVGGGGMAAGTAVLGGVVLAPVLLVGGLVLAAEGEKALTQARAYDARVRIALSEMDTLRGFLARAGRRVAELSDVLTELASRASAAMDSIDPDRFSFASPEDVARFQSAGQLVRAVGDVLRTPVLDDAGALSSASAEVLVRTRRLLG